MRKKVTCFLPILILLLVAVAVPASAGRLYDLYVSPDGTDSEQAVHWIRCNGKYCLMLHSACDLSTWRIGYDGDTFTVDGTEIGQGASATFLTPGSTVKLITGLTTYPVQVMQGSAAAYTVWLEPELDYHYISKTRSTTAQMLIVNGEGEIEYRGTVSKLRVHGNSSRFFNKKSYALKLEEKTDLLGLGNNRDFTLLALYRDSSKLRTSIAFDMASYAGLDNTMGWRLADVYFNGEYYGTFLLTGKIEVAKDRVDIRDLEEENKTLNGDVSSAEAVGASGIPAAGKYRAYALEQDPEDITGGYLLEMDVGTRAQNETSLFRTKLKNTIVVHSPEYCSVAQMEYISGLVQSFENAISASDGVDPDTGRHYTDIIDMDSFVTVYMIEEIAMEYDVNRTSQYFYKPADEQSTKLFAGPLWDFDSCFGCYKPVTATGLWAAKGTASNKQKWWYLLYQQPDFKQAVLDRWEDTFAQALQILLGNGEDPDGVLLSLDEYGALYGDSVSMDIIRWPDKDNNSTKSDTGSTFAENLTYLKQWVRTRYEWLETEWGGS